MRYPLIDFHGNMGNIDGDGPASYRYTEARLSKLSENGMLNGIKKKNVDFTYNYSETKLEPITLPAIFPNLLCNPNTGIGVAMACNWLPHNLREVAKAINDYLDGKEPVLPGPDFPTGGQIINGAELPNIIKAGRGTVKLRGRYKVEDNNIIFYELPYGVATEALMTEIGLACDEERIKGIANIRNESNKKGFRLVIECEKGTSLATVINNLFKETSLQTSCSYNQVALIDKVPTELTLKDCIKIYVNHNRDCIIRETEFDKEKVQNQLEVVQGLIRAMEDIDNIIALIKQSASSAKARDALVEKYKFSEIQAKAIVDMKLGKLAGLEKMELLEDEKGLLSELESLNLILADPIKELRARLQLLVNTFGDERRTEIINLTQTKEEKEIAFVEPEKCVVVMTEAGTIKRIPSASFRTQRRNGKGVKTQEDITSAIIRTNTIDNLMIFTNKGRMYRLLVDNIPVGTNASKGTPINSLIELENGELPVTMYSIYRDTDAKYVMFITKNGLAKKTSLDEYIKTKKKSGISAITLKENDELASVFLVKDEDIVIITEKGYGIRIKSNDIGATSRTTCGIKGIDVRAEDAVSVALPVRNQKDYLVIFLHSGAGKKFAVSELPTQNRAGKGLIIVKPQINSDFIASAVLAENSDNILIIGDTKSVCISMEDVPLFTTRSGAIGNQMIKDNTIKAVCKV